MADWLKQIPKVAPPNEMGGPRIVIPAGIGDAYWVMVKMEAFCRRHGITGKPRVLVLAEKNQWDLARLRSVPFLEMVPFIEVAQERWVSADPVEPRPQCLQEIYDESRIRHGRTVFPGFMGYEYFVSYNGLLNTGHWLEDDDLECNWHLPLRESESQRVARADAMSKYGPYAVFYFSNFTKRILRQFSVDKIVETLNHFVMQSGLTPLFVGSFWDLGWEPLGRIIKEVKGAVNLVGRTSLDEAFGLMKGASLISGYHCGLTNIGAAFGIKTVLIWDHKSFPRVTPLAVAPPETRKTTYVPLYAKGLTIDKYLGVMMDLCGCRR